LVAVWLATPPYSRSADDHLESPDAAGLGSTPNRQRQSEFNDRDPQGPQQELADAAALPFLPTLLPLLLFAYGILLEHRAGFPRVR
jgi:hypothetical protein